MRELCVQRDPIAWAFVELPPTHLPTPPNHPHSTAKLVQCLHPPAKNRKSSFEYYNAMLFFIHIVVELCAIVSRSTSSVESRSRRDKSTHSCFNLCARSPFHRICVVQHTWSTWSFFSILHLLPVARATTIRPVALTRCWKYTTQFVLFVSAQREVARQKVALISQCCIILHISTDELNESNGICNI